MHIALQVFQTSRFLERAAKKVFERHGLSLAQFNVLNLLADDPAGLRASDLAGALLVDPSNITGLLRRMSHAGWVEDLDARGDRRQRVVGLTAAGRSLWKKAHRDYEQALAVLSSALNATEQRVAAEAMRKLHEHASVLAG